MRSLERPVWVKSVYEWVSDRIEGPRVKFWETIEKLMIADEENFIKLSRARGANSAQKLYNRDKCIVIYKKSSYLSSRKKDDKEKFFNGASTSIAQ